jgi:predicted kinase
MTISTTDRSIDLICRCIVIRYCQIDGNPERRERSDCHQEIREFGCANGATNFARFADTIYDRRIDRPYPFASDLSRFTYFHKEDADPTYEAYDDTRLEVILTCSLPGNWSERHYPELAMVSLDRLRIQMEILPTEDQAKIVQAGRDLAKGYLQTATPFVWNATNIVKPIRSGLISLFASDRARIQIVHLEIPIDRVLHQNCHRQAQVPESVIYLVCPVPQVENIENTSIFKLFLNLPAECTINRVEGLIQDFVCQLNGVATIAKLDFSPIEPIV